MIPTPVKIQDGTQAKATAQPGILHALLRDLVGPLRDARSDGEKRIIVLISPTLTRCSGVRSTPCVVPVAYDMARRETAKGTWTFDLVAELERQSTLSVDLSDASRLIDFPRWSVDTLDQGQRANPAALDLLVSQPAVVDDRALLVVQFART
jgi:hypothetical protein